MKRKLSILAAKALALLGPFIILMALNHCGGWGAYPVVNTHVDGILYATPNSTPVIQINGDPYELKVGEKLLIENKFAPEPVPAPVPRPFPDEQYPTSTCFYFFAAQGGVELHVGFDDAALETLPSNNLKYDNAEQDAFKAKSDYEVTLIRQAQNPQTIKIPYGKDGKIYTNNVQYFYFRSDHQISYPTHFSEFLDTFGNETQPGNLPEGIRDRTICFADAMDPFVIEIAALPPDQGAGQAPSSPTTDQKTVVGAEGDAASDENGAPSSSCGLFPNPTHGSASAWSWLAAMALWGIGWGIVRSNPR